MAAVLLVHESALMAERLKDLMAHRGHAMTWRVSAQAGFDAVLSASFDMVILGGACSYLEGQSLASLIRASGHQGRLLALQPVDDVDAVEALSPDPTEEEVDALLRHLPKAERARQWEGLTFESLAGFDRLKAKFLARLPSQIESIKGCWLQQDLTGLGRVAHALKGSAACYGLDPVSEAALRVEQLCGQADRSQLDEAMSELIRAASTFQGLQGDCHA